MLKIYRERFIIGALVALSSTTWAGNGITTADLNPKLTATEAYAGSMASRLGTSAYEDAVLRASSLSGIQVDTSAKHPTIELALSDLPLYSVSVAKHSLTLDFMDTIVLDNLEKMFIDGGTLVSNIAATQSSASPQFVTRITLSTNRAFSIKTRHIGDNLQLTLMPQSDALDALMVKAQAQRIPALLVSTVAEFKERHAEMYAGLQSDYVAINAQLSGTLEAAKLKHLEMELLNASPSSTPLSDSTAALTESVTALQHDFKLSTLAYSQTTSKVGSAKALKGKSLDQFRKDTVTTLQSALADMATVVETLGSKVATSKRILAKTEQNAPLSSHSPLDVLSSLDSAVEQLAARIVDDAQSANSLDALQTALSTVETASPTLQLESSTNAAITSTPEQRTTMTPPAKRKRLDSHSLSAQSSIEMASLRATEEELDTAQSEGMLILSQSETDAAAPQATPAPERKSYQPRKSPVPATRGNRPDFNLYNENLSPEEDPLRQLVNLDFTDMPLNKVVSLLAQKGQINVISGTEITGTVTANLKEIPLGRAIEIVLRMNGLGILEEAGVYRITTYEEAVSFHFDTEMIFLQTAEAAAVKETLDEIVTQGGGGGGSQQQVRIGVNTQSNIIIISGPRDRINDLIEIIEQLDVAKPVIPTINRVFQLNYAEPKEIVDIISGILSENGQIVAELRSRQVVVTDIPVKIDEITDLIEELDIPVEQVSIEAMIIDHVISDGAEVGVDLLAAVDDVVDSGAKSFQFDSVLAGPSTGGVLQFGFVIDDFELSGILSAQIANSDSELLANPVVVTLENKLAVINISTEYPFREIQQSGEGGNLAGTEFKDIGTILEVTPQITFDKNIIAEISAKQSSVLGFTDDGIPIEAKRDAQTTMRIKNGQTVYIAGLRRYDETITDQKVPFLGDVPVLNLLFKKHKTELRNNELMIFLTCTIIEDYFSELTPHEKAQYDLIGGTPLDETNAMPIMMDAFGKNPIRDPFYKWRRPK